MRELAICRAVHRHPAVVHIHVLVCVQKNSSGSQVVGSIGGRATAATAAATAAPPLLPPRVHPASFIPVATNASAVFLISRSVTPQAKWFHEFQPSCGSGKPFCSARPPTGKATARAGRRLLRIVGAGCGSRGGGGSRHCQWPCWRGGLEGPWSLRPGSGWCQWPTGGPASRPQPRPPVDQFEGLRYYGTILRIS